MEHYFNSDISIKEIARALNAENNNPLVKDVMRIARLWHEDKNGSRKLLSYEYDERNNRGTFLCNIEYDSTGNYTSAIITVGRGCIASDILYSNINLIYSAILHLASTKLELRTTGSVSRNDVLGVVGALKYDGSFQLKGNDYIELSMKNININQTMNCIKSIEKSYSTRNYTAVTMDW